MEPTAPPAAPKPASVTTPALAALAVPLADEAATLALGAALAHALALPLHAPFIVTLSGELGAGKTTLTRGVLRGLGWQGAVKSPTYTLVELYKFSRLNLYHFDFYRLSDPQEWQEAGFRDLLGETSLCLIEWPEKAVGGMLPPPDLSIRLASVMATPPDTPESPESRLATLTAHTVPAQCLLAQLDLSSHPR